MYKPLETLRETVGFDEQTRSLYSMDAFSDWEKGTFLHDLYDYWKNFPVIASGLPHMDSCRPKSALPHMVAERICCIDTSADNPLDYIVREHAANALPGFGVELSGRPLCDRPELDMDTTACAIEFMSCKLERKPLYHEIDQLLGGLKRHYMRLMLPVQNDAGEVDLIYFAIRDLQPAKRVTFHFVGEN